MSGLVAGKAGRMARVVRGVVNKVDVRKSDTPDQDGGEKGGEHRRDNALRPGDGLRSATRLGADDCRFHELLLKGHRGSIAAP